MTKDENRADTNNESRLDRLDRDVVNMQQDMAGVKTDISYIREEMGVVSKSIKGIGEQNKTNWGTLAAWATVIIAILMYHNTLVLKPYDNYIQQALTSQNAIISKLDKHEKLEGHPVATEKLKHLEKRVEEANKEREKEITKLDETLQREMRLLDNAQASRVEGEIQRLDTTLQREMSLKDQILEERIKALQKMIDEIREEQKARTSKVYNKDKGP